MTERSGPQCPSLTVTVDITSGLSRDQIADRIRVAASVMANLHQSDIPLHVRLGERKLIPRHGREGFIQIMEALTDVPADGDGSARLPQPPRNTASITISSDELGNPTVHTIDPSVNHRLNAEHQHRVIESNTDLATQLLNFWAEVRDANLVA